MPCLRVEGQLVTVRVVESDQASVRTVDHLGVVDTQSVEVLRAAREVVLGGNLDVEKPRNPWLQELVGRPAEVPAGGHDSRYGTPDLYEDHSHYQ